MLVFLLDCLRFNKLLEILPSVWCNFNNLLKCKQSSRKTSIVCRWLYFKCKLNILFFSKINFYYFLFYVDVESHFAL